ncbi:MAG: ImmA/IrrE family metallo-endopeptidase [Novosphingopyxis baekryungensis]|nr:ImmA/IrrE family metallo-endopeptidase [Novosphingopyxis baekryungensis]
MRAEWARKCGERKAKQHGFSCFPIDPFKIAEDENIFVQAKSANQIGVSGGIIFKDEDVGIFYATNITSLGFQRFTVGHELGHYFLEGHPEEILKAGPLHASRAGFSQGDQTIEIEADHFSSGLLLPGHLVRKALWDGRIGLEGIEELAELSECSLTASAIRAAECSPYPMAVVVSRADRICYGFLSDSFKQLRPRAFPRKGDLLPDSTTRQFNLDDANIRDRKRLVGETMMADWFDGPSGVALDEEVLGLGTYGYTLSVFSSEELPDEPDEY